MGYSLFFEGALRGPFKEAFTTMIYLPSTPSAVFKLFLDWTAKQLPLFSASRHPSRLATQASWDQHFIEACEFAYTHSITDFEETLSTIFMNAYFPRCEDSNEALNALPSGESISRLHHALLPTSKLIKAISRAHNKIFNNLLGETVPRHLQPMIFEYRTIMGIGHSRRG